MRRFFENFLSIAGTIILVDLIYPRLRGFDPKPFADMLIDATIIALIVAGILWIRNRRANDQAL